MNKITQNITLTCTIFLLSACSNKTKEVDIEKCFVNKFKEMNAVIKPYEYENYYWGHRNCYSIWVHEKQDVFGSFDFCVQDFEDKKQAKETWEINYKRENSDYFKAPEYMVLYESQIINAFTNCGSADHMDTVFTVLSSCFEENNVKYDDMIHALCGGRVVH